jgi:hypothetical protein
VQEAKFANPLMIPAGVDTGKLLESQLRLIQSEGIGPKKLKPPPPVDRSLDEESV